MSQFYAKYITSWILGCTEIARAIALVVIFSVLSDWREPSTLKNTIHLETNKNIER